MAESNRTHNNFKDHPSGHSPRLDFIANRVLKAAQERRIEQQMCYTPQNRELIHRIIAGLQVL